MKNVFVLFCSVLMSPVLLADDSKAEVVSADEVLASKGGVSVSAADVKQYINDRIEVIGSRDKLLAQRNIAKKSVENLLLIRYFAKKVREQNASSDELWQQQLFVDRALMDYYLKQMLAAKKQDMNLEANAKEYYIANPDEFIMPRLIRAEHILLKSENENKAVLLEQIQKRLKAGEKFGDLAFEFSDDPSAKQNKGDLGFFAKGKMVPEFEEAAFALTEVGQLSEPVETKFGTHLIRLVADNGAGKQSFDTVKDSIIEKLVGPQLTSYRQSLITEARSGISYDQEKIESIIKGL